MIWQPVNNNINYVISLGLYNFNKQRFCDVWLRKIKIASFDFVGDATSHLDSLLPCLQRRLAVDPGERHLREIHRRGLAYEIQLQIIPRARLEFLILHVITWDA